MMNGSVLQIWFPSPEFIFWTGVVIAFAAGWLVRGMGKMLRKCCGGPFE